MAPEPKLEPELRQNSSAPQSCFKKSFNNTMTNSLSLGQEPALSRSALPEVVKMIPPKKRKVKKSEEESWSCPVCKKKFDSSSELDEHWPRKGLYHHLNLNFWLLICCCLYTHNGWLEVAKYEGRGVT